jgi:hypothetical protein
MNPETSSPRLNLCLGAALAGICLLVFFRLLSADFVNFDDDLYVYENPHVQNGLSIQGLEGAFTRTLGHHYQPLTVLSYMLDAQIYGMNPFGFHFTNLLLHIANVLLVFVLLRRMTGSLWRSAFVAALFAIHPLRVESVAWVTERKDVLSTFFWLLAMLAWLGYVRAPNVKNMLLTFLALTLGLLAKQMLVTAPFLLVLLDYWPLGRLQRDQDGKPTFWRLVYEKLPLFLLVGVFMFIALYFVRFGVVAPALDELSLGARISNGLVSYVRYIGKMFWPAELLIFYPHPGDTLPFWQIAGAGLLLLATSGLVVWQIRSRPYLFVGWFWFLGTLFPLIGLAQTGHHAMGDRFTYVPMIGLFIIVAWGVYDLSRFLQNPRVRKLVLGSVAGAVIVACSVRAWFQTGHWQNSVTVYRPVIRAGVAHYIIYNNLGLALLNQGDIQAAMKNFSLALALKPENAKTHLNIGLALVKTGRFQAAAGEFREAIRIRSDYADAYDNLAIALYLMGDYQGAWEQVRNCQRLGGKPHPEFLQALEAKHPAPEGKS